MKLQTTLKNKGLSIGDLAVLVGAHYTHIHRILHGKRRPSPELAAKIEAATNGGVTIMELLFPERQNEQSN